MIDIRRHNANFCAPHFLHHCEEQVAKTIDELEMLRAGDRVLVAVSGGKDSLGLWDLLLRLGYEADGLYIGLGIDGYSDESGVYARAFARERDATLVEIDLVDDYGFDVPSGAKAAKRVPCSACGLSKRHLFDKAALDGGYDVVATGHNLDDEAAVLFGNVLRWNTEYLARQHPVLPAARWLPAKGEAARAARRTRDGGVLRAARHRLPSRGVPDGRRQSASRVQGRAERDRSAIARVEARVLLRVPRQGRPVARRRGRRRQGRARAVRAV